MPSGEMSAINGYTPTLTYDGGCQWSGEWACDPLPCGFAATIVLNSDGTWDITATNSFGMLFSYRHFSDLPGWTGPCDAVLTDLPNGLVDGDCATPGVSGYGGTVNITPVY